jgi:hypothetical protein
LNRHGHPWNETVYHSKCADPSHANDICGER